MHSTWDIFFVVGKEDEADLDCGNATDYVNVYLGNNPQSLCFITKVRNCHPDSRNIIRYPIFFKIRGNQLAFRFEYFSSTKLPEHHLIIKRGWYRQDITMGVEKTATGILSDYIKKLKLESLSGGARLNALQEEYNRVKEWHGAVIDSIIYNSYPQVKVDVILEIHERRSNEMYCEGN